jgi:hypothetical protein
MSLYAYKNGVKSQKEKEGVRISVGKGGKKMVCNFFHFFNAFFFFKIQNIHKRLQKFGLMGRTWGRTQEPLRQKHSSFLILLPWLQMFFFLCLLKCFLPQLIISFDEISVSELRACSKWYHQCRIFLISCADGTTFPAFILVLKGWMIGVVSSSPI